MGHGRALLPPRAAESHAREADRAVAELAGRQHGVVARRQLVALGLTRHEIAHRLARASLHRVHPRAYAVGHRVLSREGRWMAAVLSIGADAVLSHRSAAALWGIRETARARIDVAVPRALRSPPAIQLHRVRLSADEVTEQRGLRVTTPPRTLLDLAAVLTRPQLERALNEAEILRLADSLSVAEIVDRHPRRQGTRAIRAMLAGAQLGDTVTRSEFEDRFLAFLDEAVPQRVEVNAVIEVNGRRFEVDCLWRDRRLVAELDGHAVHGTTAGFERDRARDRILQAAGWRVVRVTWRQLHEDRAALASDLRRLLAE